MYAVSRVVRLDVEVVDGLTTSIDVLEIAEVGVGSAGGGTPAVFPGQ